MGWDVTAGAGWQSTKYSGRQADGSFHDDQGTGIVMTNFNWDITSDAEFDLNYQIQAGFEDSENVNHNLRAMLSIDFVGDFDLDVGFQWDRIGNPVPLEDGTIPQSDDYRVTVGLGWDF